MTRWPSIRVHATVGVSAANGGALGSLAARLAQVLARQPGHDEVRHRRVGHIAHALCELRDLRGGAPEGVQQTSAPGRADRENDGRVRVHFDFLSTPCVGVGDGDTVTVLDETPAARPPRARTPRRTCCVRLTREHS